MNATKMAIATALVATCSGGLAQAKTFFTPTFDSAPAVVGASPAAPDSTTVVFVRKSTAVYVLSRPGGDHWWLSPTDVFQIIGDHADGDPAATYMTTGGTPVSGTPIMVALHGAGTGLMYAGVGHVQLEPLQVPEGATFEPNWSPALSAVGSKTFNASSSPVLVRVQSFPTGAWYTTIVARAPDNQLWAASKADGSNSNNGCCWGNWGALPTFPGGFASDPTVITPGDTRLLMVCAQAASTGQYQCARTQFGNGGSISWTAWGGVSNFFGYGTHPPRPVLARSNTTTYLLSTAPIIANDNEAISGMPNSGGSWTNVVGVGSGSGFFSGSGALAISSSPSVLSLALGADHAVWWNASDPTTSWGTWNEVQAYVGVAVNYSYPAAYAFDLGSSRGYTGDGNWAGSENTGECAATQWGIGVSAAANGTDVPHSLLCATHGWANNYTSNQHTIAFSGANVGYGNHVVSPADWDYGYYKAECAANEVITGLSQQVNGALHEVRCSAIGGTGTTSASLGVNCRPRVFASGNSQESPGSGSDWANGYYKGECAQGSAVAGISRDPNTGGVHAILCCDFGVL